jgi:hypothetical protein
MESLQRVSKRVLLLLPLRVGLYVAVCSVWLCRWEAVPCVCDLVACACVHMYRQ